MDLKFRRRLFIVVILALIVLPSQIFTSAMLRNRSETPESWLVAHSDMSQIQLIVSSSAGKAQAESGK